MPRRDASTSFKDDLVLGLDDTGLDHGSPALTLTGPKASGVVVYGHGYGVRLRVSCDKARRHDVLQRLGWSATPPESNAWRLVRPGWWVMRGSAWLTHTGPGVGKKSKSSPLVLFNRKFKTRLYGLGVDLSGDDLHLELQGVRSWDIEKICNVVAQLGGTEYSVEHYLTAERYIVLTPADAEHLASQLGSKACTGRGAYARKASLLRDHEVPIQVRRRARTKGLLSVYRIQRGATWAYKMEVRLRGRRRDRQQFAEADIAKLDFILLEYVDRYGLRPIQKPSRWEPRERSSQLEVGPYDPCVRPLGQKVWRGRSMDMRYVRRIRGKCHTPTTVQPLDELYELDASQGEVPSIRSLPLGKGSWVKAESTKHPMDATVYIREGTAYEIEDVQVQSNPIDALMADIARLPGALVEVALPDDVDPSRFIESFIQHRVGRRVGVGLVGSISWYLVQQGLVPNHPITDQTQDLVLVIDPMTLSNWSDSLDVILHPETSLNWDMGIAESRAMAANLWELLKYYRQCVEETGGLVVLFTVDHRPDSGRGEMRPSNFWTDARVRTFIGDAGRYWSHQRYLVEYTQTFTLRDSFSTLSQITLIKDEAEGLVGRQLSWTRKVS